MIIETSAVFSVLTFVCGIAIGVYIMTQIDNKRERELVNQLLQLEENIRNYKVLLTHKFNSLKQKDETRNRKTKKSSSVGS
mgnify:CR=1 FL=1|tara:strand:+ start:351 stop:593 length:243 start_codon:yes stop_codon:yes gene_type:complete